VEQWVKINNDRKKSPSFTLLPTSGRVYIWRTPKEAYNPECLVPTVKHRTGSAMVWAAILWYNFLLVPLLLFMAEYCKGIHGQVG
jgi:hypothetical protein